MQLLGMWLLLVFNMASALSLEGAWSRQEGDAWLLSSNVHKQDFFLSDLPSLSRMLLIVKVQLILLIN